MKRPTLPTRWCHWRRRRYGRLLSSGLGPELAWPIANGEAWARRRVARVLGVVQARNAQLVCLPEGENFRFALLGGMEGVPVEKMSRLVEEAGASRAWLLDPRGMHKKT